MSDDSKIVVSTPVEEGEPQADFTGCLASIVENGTFALGMILMFSKTVDLMTAFAPRTIMGYTGMEVAYGFAVGLLVEGAMFVMKLLLPRAKNPLDWLWSVLVVLAPFAISALSQVFDSFQVKGALDAQPESMQVFVAWFVPSIPTIVIALLIGKSIFSSIPSEMMPKGMIVKSLGKNKSKPVNAKGVVDSVIGAAKSLLPGPTKAGENQEEEVGMPIPDHAPALCVECKSTLPFLEYGSKTGKNGRPAKWPIYEKCSNPNCSIGRRNLKLPKQSVPVQ